MAVTIEIKGSKAFLQAPFNPQFPSQARALGGDWDKTARLWVFPSFRAPDASKLAQKFWGEVTVVLPTAVTQAPPKPSAPSTPPPAQPKPNPAQPAQPAPPSPVTPPAQPEPQRNQNTIPSTRLEDLWEAAQRLSKQDQSRLAARLLERKDKDQS